MGAEMNLQKINVKFFTAGGEQPPLTDFIAVFHSWIQANDGVYHDIADYSHMQAGPGIVLVAQDANLSIDETEKRRGLLYSQKSPLQGSNQERLTEALRYALENAVRLERHPGLEGKVRFSGDELLICVNDRLLAPNTDQAFDAIKPDIEAAATSLYRSGQLVIERDAEPRRRLTVRVKASRSYAVDELLHNVQSSQTETSRG
jgi:hypothetical protein